MPIGIVSDDDFVSELDDSSQDEDEKEVEFKRWGPGRTKPNIPEGLREIVADEAIENGNKSASTLVETLGGTISQPTVDRYKKGDFGKLGDDDSTNRIQEKRVSIINRSNSAILDALNTITPEKLEEASVKVAASVARDLSGVVKNMEVPKETESGHVQFNFYVPPMKKLNQFEVIDVD